MKLWHRFPNLYFIGRLSLLGLVALGNPTLAIADISERSIHKEVITTDTELPKEISPTLSNAGDTLEKVEQSEPSSAQEALFCSLKNAIASGGTRSAIASCSKAGTDELHFDALTPSAIASGGAQSAIAQTTVEDIPQEPTLTLDGSSPSRELPKS